MFSHCKLSSIDRHCMIASTSMYFPFYISLFSYLTWTSLRLLLLPVDYMQYDYNGPENKVAVKVFSKYKFTRYILNWNTGQMLKFTLPKNGG